MKSKNNPHIGSNFDDFLRKEGIYEEVEAAALKKVIASALTRQMKRRHISVSRLAAVLGTSRAAVNRVLDDQNTSITLKTMAKAAEALNLEMTLTVKQLPLGKLERIAGQLAATGNAKKATELKKQFLEGYYGKSVTRLDA